MGGSMSVGSLTPATQPVIADEEGPVRELDTRNRQAESEAFVGREREMEILRARIDDALEGKGSIVLISGEPGIGKTRLLSEASRYAELKGILTIWGRCWEGEGAPAFWPWRHVLRKVASDDGPSSEADPYQMYIRSILDDIGTSSIGPPDAAENPWQATIDYSSAARFQVFDRLASTIRRASEAQPVLIAIDDIHDADSDSLALVEFLASDLEGARLVIIVSYRSQEVALQGRFEASLLPIIRNCLPHRVELSGLGLADVAELISIHSCQKEPSKALARALHERTSGNPFFVVETCRFSAAIGVGSPVLRPDLATTIRTLIRARVCRISRECEDLLNAASVAGAEFSVRVVASMLGKAHRDALDDPIAEAIAHGFLRFNEDAALQYSFSHCLVRDSLYLDIPSSARRKMHQQAANALLYLYADDTDITIDMIAYHMYQAGDQIEPSVAVTYLIRAGKRALDAFAYEKALSHFQRALELRQPFENLDDKCDLQLLLGEAQMKTGMWTEARSTFAEILATSRRINAPSRFAAAAVGMKGMTRGTLPPDWVAIRALREALSIVPDEDSRTSAMLLTALSSGLYFVRRGSESADLASRAVDHAKKSKDPAVIGDALEAKIFAAYRYDCLPEMLQGCEELESMALEAGSDDLIFRAKIFKYIGLTQHNDVRAMDELQLCINLAEALRHPRYTWQINLARASRALGNGEVALATSLVGKIRAQGKRYHDPTSDQHLVLLQFMLAKLEGRYDAVLPSLAALVSAAPDYPLPRAGLAFAEAATGDHAKAQLTLAPITQARLAPIHPDGFALITLTILAECLALLGPCDWATQLQARLQPFEDQFAIAGWGTALEGSIAHHLAIVSLVLGDTEKAYELGQKAVAMNRNASLEFLAVRSSALCARVLHTSGDHVGEAKLAASVSEYCTGKGVLNPYPGSPCATAVLQGASASVDQECGVKALRDVENRFALEGEYWLIRFEGTEFRLRDCKGLQHLHNLIMHQGAEVAALELVRLSTRRSGSFESSTGRSLEIAAREQSSDLDALRAYRARLREIATELDDPIVNTDLGMRARLQCEREKIESHLLRETGLFGRSRIIASDAERARVNVRNAISSAIRRISLVNQGCARHLDYSIRTGRLCAYAPQVRTEWGVS